MSYQSSAIIGSGTTTFVGGILPADQRGFEAAGRGIRTGTNVVLINPEDVTSVDAFVASGVLLTTAVVELVGPNSNPLPRCREIVIQNTDTTNDVLIGHFSSFTDLEGFLVSANTEPATSVVRLPLMHNVSIYARAAAGTATVKLLIW